MFSFYNREIGLLSIAPSIGGRENKTISRNLKY
nr:MAG TPA: hypothetical protein [Caudoviricetes sp.]